MISVAHNQYGSVPIRIPLVVVLEESLDNLQTNVGLSCARRTLYYRKLLGVSQLKGFELRTI